MKRLIDVDGLSCSGNREQAQRYALALGYSKDEYVQQGHRLSTLIRLQHDREVQVITGPIGARYWSLASPEVFVTVVPDGYDYKYRTTDTLEWAYRAVGLTDVETKQLRSLVSGPTKRNKLYSKVQQAQQLHGSLLAMQGNVQLPRHEESTVQIIYTIADQIHTLKSLRGLNAFDFEWTYESSDPKLDGRLIGLNISTANTDYYFPVLGKGVDNSVYAPILVDAVFKHVKAHPTVWHNAKADIQAIYPNDPMDLVGAPIEDTILMAYVAGEPSLGLKDLAEKLLDRKSVPLPAHLEDQPVEMAARYGAAGDTRNTYNLYFKLKKMLEDTEQFSIYEDIERPLVPLVASMEKYGIPVDIEEVKRLRAIYAIEEADIRYDILTKFSLDFDKVKDQKAYLSKHGFHSDSLDKTVLQKIEAPWITPLLNFRGIKTLRNNFLDKHIETWETQGRPAEYRLYPTFNQAGRDTENGSWKNAPATGRMSSAAPNLQNQPRAIRSCFIAPPGCVLISLDYSALELRLAAAISEDPVMLSVLGSGGDLHQHMREVIEDATGIDVGRPTAKTANFNLRYGGQADMLITIAAKEGAHLTYDVAKAIVAVDQEEYSGYWKWFKQCVGTSTLRGYSSTIKGRRRYNKNLGSSNNILRGEAERAACNMVVQGTGADIIKTAMGRIAVCSRSFGAHLALQVHDELVFWVPEENAQQFFSLAKSIMESIQIPHLSLKVEGGIGNNWAEIH